jgi:hypothetical protein
MVVCVWLTCCVLTCQHTFVAKIGGAAPVNVTWLRGDGEVLPEGENSNHLSLEVTAESSGLYKLVVSNAYGSDETETNLAIICTSGCVCAR